MLSRFAQNENLFHIARSSGDRECGSARLVPGGAGTSLVGSHDEVADLIEEYREVGIDTFVLSAYPHLEGAYWFGEGVLPVLEERGLWKPPAAPFTRSIS